MKYCLCGCGKEIILKRHHKRLGIPDYIWGHRNLSFWDKALWEENMKGGVK